MLLPFLGFDIIFNLVDLLLREILIQLLLKRGQFAIIILNDLGWEICKYVLFHSTQEER